MIRRTTLGALAVALLVLAAPPGAAKGPTQVEVHDERTGTTTLLDDLHNDFQRVRALEELVGWPEDVGEPNAMSRGRLELVATLTWRYGEDSTAWVDRVYADRGGRTWIQRHPHPSGNGSTTWGRVESAAAFRVVLNGIIDPSWDTTQTPRLPVRSAAEPAAGAAARRSDPTPETSAGLDGSSFGWGAGLTGALGVGLAVAARWRRQRSVTASRNSRVSSAASS